MKKVFFISNGETYSEFQVYGGVIAEENELPVLEAILRYAIMDVTEAYKEWHKVWDDHLAAGGRYGDVEFDKAHPKPDEEVILQTAFAKHGFTFTPYEEDMVLP